MNRTECRAPLRAGHGGYVDVRSANVLADPLVRRVAPAGVGHALLMDFVVVETAVVGHHGEQRDAISRRRPKRRAAHQEVAVADQRRPADAQSRATRAPRQPSCRARSRSRPRHRSPAHRAGRRCPSMRRTTKAGSEPNKWPSQQPPPATRPPDAARRADPAPARRGAGRPAPTAHHARPQALRASPSTAASGVHSR